MKQVAIYGKGGIGKSTLAANISVALAQAGARVLQMGCDPKHDSTRLLLDGARVTTVLDYLRDTAPAERALSDVVHVGFAGVDCVEAGGPEPGVGCAGRGILSTFDLLEKLGIQSEPYDVVVYDVLGDVVCGGFAVPLRREYADVICVVTSGEYMSIYAANNILRGVKNYDGHGPRLAGILFNQRGVEDEAGRVRRFAAAVGLPILLTIPRSDLFAGAERQGQTLLASHPHSALAAGFEGLARQLLVGVPLLPAQPLSDEELERVVLGRSNPTDPDRPAPAAAPARHTLPLGSPTQAARYLSKSVRRREPLHGCAFCGAVAVSTQIAGAVTVAHGPQSCAHLASQTVISAARRTAAVCGITMGHQLTPPLISSQMNEGVVIFGGAGELESAIRQAAGTGVEVIFVATTCPAGIIGDDLGSVLGRLGDLQPRPRIIPISTDGNLAGDYLQGLINAYLEGASALIDPGCAPQPDLVNIVAEKNIATSTEPNYRTVCTLLELLGLRVNARFVFHSSVEELAGFRRAPLNLLAYDDYLGRTLRQFLTERFGAVFAQAPFPVGLSATQAWLEEVAGFFGRMDRLPALLERFRQEYQARIARVHPTLAGKRLMIVTYNHSLDWILEAALDAGMQIAKVGVLNYTQDDLFRSRFVGQIPVETGYPPERREEEVAALRPDLVLSNYSPITLLEGVHYDTLPLCPDVGFDSGLRMVERWSRLLRAPAIEGWKHDEYLFTQRAAR